MVRTKHPSPTEFAYPVERICGKISRHSKVIHACTPSGKRITYLQGKRDMEAHPVTPAETNRQDLFKRRLLAASARYAKSASTYAADMADYTAQLQSPTPIIRFRRYIWSLVKAEITG